MSQAINFKSEDVDETTSDFNKISGYFSGETLSQTAYETTLIANSNIDIRFEEDQEWIATLGKLIDSEASNINKIGVAFEEYDELLADFGVN